MHSRAPKEKNMEGNTLLGQTSIRETVLDVSVEGKVTVDGMETTSWALHRIDQHYVGRWGDRSRRGGVLRLYQAGEHHDPEQRHQYSGQCL